MTSTPKNIFEYAVSAELVEEARIFCESIPRVGLPASIVPKYIKPTCEILPGHSETTVVDRIKEIFDQAGIEYTYSNYAFKIDRDHLIQLNVYRNEGEHIRTRSKYATNTIPLPEGELNFVVELDDLTRIHRGILDHIVKNYTAETISKFCIDDYPSLYCSS
jgi:hypothetical protein